MPSNPQKTVTFDYVTNIVANTPHNSSELDSMRDMPQTRLNISLGVS